VDGTTFRGRVVWLTHDQGGRRSGPPSGGPTREFQATGFVPPYAVEDGLASFWLSEFEPGAWSSPAAARRMLADNIGPHRVQSGSLVVVTEGRKPVAYFHVHEVVSPPE
jgi:hypothetical protein